MADAQREINTRAIEIASGTAKQLDSHERLCAERMTELREFAREVKQGVQDVHSRINRLFGIWLTVGGGAVLLLIGAVAALVMRNLPSVH